MNIKLNLYFLFVNISLFIVFCSIASGQGNLDVKQDFQRFQDNYNNKWDTLDKSKVKGWKQFKRWEYFWKQRFGNEFKLPDNEEISKYIELELRKNSKENRTQGSNWIQVGPFDNPLDNGSKQGIGRINVVRLNPKNENEVWVGAAGGGLWKSSDGGKNWSEAMITNVLTSSISDIAISESNPNIIYVATGDADGSIGSGGKDFYSNGVYISTNHGTNWFQTNLKYQLSNNASITRILVNPKFPDSILASSADGIYVSNDGGNIWQKTLGGVSIKDMEFNPTNSNIIYASTIGGNNNSGIYQSLNSGLTWKKIYSNSDCNRINLAVTKANPNMIFALCSKASTNGFLSFVVSNDNGKTWNVRQPTKTYTNYLDFYNGADNNGQGVYDLSIAASPVDSNEITIGGVNIWKSIDGGNSFQQISYWLSNKGIPFLKSDQHEIIYSKDGKSMYSANDGGLNFWNKETLNWDYLNKGLPITQFYKMSASQTNPKMLIAGAQDNGTMLDSNGLWKKVNGADGMQCIIDPLNSDIQYSSIYYGDLSRKLAGQQNFKIMLDTATLRKTYNAVESGDWVTPFVIDPNNDSILYAGYNNIWKNSNFGDKNSWKKISDFKFNITNNLKNIAVAPSNSNFIYTSSSFNVYFTSNGGLNWNNIISSNNTITSIAVQNNDPRVIYITKSGFTLNDKVYIYKNQKLINLSGNLPNVPINCIIYQENSNDRIYIGTDLGVYYSDNNSSFWQRFSTDLPFTVVMDMQKNNTTKKIFAATYGRGIWTNDLDNCSSPKIKLNHQITDSITICEGDSVLLTTNEILPNYFWSNGVRSKDNYIKKTGSYYLLSDTNNICSAKSEKIDVNVIVKPIVQILKLGSFDLCEGDSVKLLGTFGLQNYKWSNGDTIRTTYVKLPGKYYYSAINNNGCFGYSDTVTIEYLKPKISQENLHLISTEAISYQWYFNENILVSDTIQNISPLENGNYKVLVKFSNGCIAKSDNFYYTRLSVNNEKNMNEISLQPFPVDNKLIISNLSFFNIRIIKIYDLLGNNIADVKLDQQNFINEFEFDVSKFSIGTYFIEFVSDKYVLSKIFIKK